MLHCQFESFPQFSYRVFNLNVNSRKYSSFCWEYLECKFNDRGEQMWLLSLSFDSIGKNNIFQEKLSSAFYTTKFIVENFPEEQNKKFKCMHCLQFYTTAHHEQWTPTKRIFMTFIFFWSWCWIIWYEITTVNYS